MANPRSTRTRTLEEREISADGANRISILLDSIERILKREQERIQSELDREAPDRHLGHPGLPADLRWRVMVLGSSTQDINFWIRREDQEGGQWYILTEIETGTDVGAVEPREACEAYFRNDILGNTP